MYRDKMSTHNTNREAILRCLLKQDVVTRSDLVRDTGVSMPTVQRIVESLLREGLVKEIGNAGSTGGRPSRLLTINIQNYALIGVTIAPDHMDGVVCDLNGKVRNRVQVGTAPRLEDKDWASVEELIHRLLDRAFRDFRRVLGVALVLERDIREQPQYIGWMSNMVDYVRRRFGMYVLSCTTSEALALGEYWFSGQVDDLNVVTITETYNADLCFMRQGEIVIRNVNIRNIRDFWPTSATTGELNNQFRAFCLQAKQEAESQGEDGQEALTQAVRQYISENPPRWIMTIQYLYQADVLIWDPRGLDDLSRMRIEAENLLIQRDDSRPIQIRTAALGQDCVLCGCVAALIETLITDDNMTSRVY